MLSAWFSESCGSPPGGHQGPQAVTGCPDHDARVARVRVPVPGGRSDPLRARRGPRSACPVRFDYGTWTARGRLRQRRTDDRRRWSAVPAGRPRSTCRPDRRRRRRGADQPVRADLDGVGDGPHWVDRAPGGTGAPAAPEYGADYVVGSCVGGGGGPGGGGVRGCQSVELRAPAKRVGRGKARVRGSVAPARAGVPVELTIEDRRKITRRLTTGADGTFSASVPITETTRLRAVAGGLRSQTLTITMLSKTRIKVRRLRNGGVLVQRAGQPGAAGARAPAADERGQARRQDHHPKGPVQLPLQAPPSRPLPGRVHSIQRPRRAVHIQQGSNSMKLSLSPSRRAGRGGGLTRRSGVRVGTRLRLHRHQPESIEHRPRLRARRSRSSNQTRHVVTNHGFTMRAARDKRRDRQGHGRLLEAAGRLPRLAHAGARRSPRGDTAAQPHATCRGVAALEAEDGDPRAGRTPTPSTTTSRSRRQPPASRTILLAGSRTSWRSRRCRGPRAGQRRPGAGRDGARALCGGLGQGRSLRRTRPRRRTASLNSGYAHELTEPLDAEILRSTTRWVCSARTCDRQGQRLLPLRRPRRRRRPTRRTRH